MKVTLAEMNAYIASPLGYGILFLVGALPFLLMVAGAAFAPAEQQRAATVLLFYWMMFQGAGLSVMALLLIARGVING